jgi:hypothetical protein
MSVGGIVQWTAYMAVVVFAFFVLANLAIIGSRLLGSPEMAKIIARWLSPVVYLFRLGDPPKDSVDRSGA